ncbi:restriction modification enzyme : Possible restriction /modification enzyme OS=Microcystis aeruginosa NIES-44 GN=N44_00644 PE=4 SV=1: Methyltransf_26 [Gemmata massiliana]|uniref:site-specific DNA-methyltransferase (adenine-specific) n=1 Tax=Gemmata massiliana TaxID=1210884 RepID=A0A6P2CYE4_9BACT|nr:N-6 DNA methylase [Gemmata massiliana]VTR94138.1 restriction modification enzyme : Possible restriction /modification enzyme OS=Microcystis aeruginosa NIES-44 GN=N44_00644 PE=4 SV=1: Methyltransf_26 [Gemmata massiliana]
MIDTYDPYPLNETFGTVATTLNEPPTVPRTPKHVTRTTSRTVSTTGDLYSPLHNSGAFSGHWLENRLELEPEWRESETDVVAAFGAIEQLWERQRDLVAKYGNEQSLEHAFIQPVMAALGWKLVYQTHLQQREPDYALLLNDLHHRNAVHAGHMTDEFWRSAALVADAKRWDLSLDKKFGSGAKREYPPEQIEWYLDRSRKPFGILTNGRLWRLIPRELGSHQRRFQTYYQVDLVAILEGYAQGMKLEALDDFRRFFLLFGPVGFAEREGRKPLIQRAVEGSSEYRIGVSEGLKDRAFEALRLCIEGFLAWKGNELDRAKNARESDFEISESKLWDDVHDLFDLIDSGGPRYGVAAYNGGLFDPTVHQFLDEKKLSDWHLARVVDCLGRAVDPEHVERGVFRVDYRDLALQHLGGIYEGLLELHPAVATEKMVVCSRRNKGVLEEQCVPAGAPVPAGFTRSRTEYEPRSIYLIKDKGERRAFGSYYTPDHIVDHIVRQTIAPLCEGITEKIRREIEAEEKGAAKPEKLRTLNADFPNRALALRIVDPAMGSGHFLLSACQHLAEQIATNPFTPADPEGISGNDSLSYWKRQVVEHCIFGVDTNPLAVDLAKLALWLETVVRDRPLSFLDHHLKCGDSLLGARLHRLSALHDIEGLVAIPFESKFERKLPGLLEPLTEIRRLPSDSVKQVKRKLALLGAYRDVVEPFWDLAQLWCADASGDHVDSDHYLDVIKNLDKPSKLKGLATRDWYSRPVSFATSLNCFHWDLAFPEVFCKTSNSRSDVGFDAVIGNPPYEVLSEKESGMDTGHLKTFVENEPTYTPARRGKQNLYKLFICRSLDLLRDKGRFGFIVPMAVLGDDQAADIRRYLIQRGQFTAVDAFPQKDNPKKRVFVDAKLSTGVFSYVKVAQKVSYDMFPSRLWSANVLTEKPLGELTLSTADLLLYDPANCTIVSCAQADWDLAVRIMKSGRMTRLRELTEFFQGEVNETNERANGTLTPAGNGKLVTRGASICLYVPRLASQGEDLYLDTEKFTAGKGKETKAFHHKYRRIGWQESSPQNNFRRVIAALIPVGEFCNHKVNYCSEHTSKLPLEFVLALLNSTLSDWYFRLGSTNASVSHYQVSNLPCPIFRGESTARESEIGQQVLRHLTVGRCPHALALLSPLLETAPFSPILQDAVVVAARRIIELESKRGEISRTDRSELGSDAQHFQDFIDALLFGMAGLTAEEVVGLKDRYAELKLVK